MSLRPKKVVKPLRSECKFDLDPGTKIRVVTHDDEVFVGYLRSNPSTTGQFLELLLKDHEDPCEKEKKKLDVEGKLQFCRIPPEDILEIHIVEEAPKFVRKVKVEKIYQTVVVDKKEGFADLLKVFEGVDKVGLNLHGIFVGRNGTVGWIAIFAANVIFCIDVLELPKKQTDFWSLMNVHLFKNDRILKVMYNSRPIADYLYHKHCISLRNVFDVQVAEFYIWTQWQTREELQTCGTENYKRLSDCLKIFVPSEVLDAELTLLKEFEEQNFSVKNPLMKRPVQEIEKKACKWVATDVKYLLQLHEVMMTRLIERYTCCVSQQMESLVIGNNATMEVVLNQSLCIPPEVLNKIIGPRSKCVTAKYVNTEHSEIKPTTSKKDNKRAATARKASNCNSNRN